MKHATRWAGIAAAALGLAIGAAGRARADMTVYSDQAAFLAAVSNPGVNTYNDLTPDQHYDGPLSRTAGAFSYSAAARNGFDPAGSASDVWLSTDTSVDTITFSNFSAGVQAVGGFFFGSNISGNFLAGQSITVATTDSSGTTTETLTDTTTSTFLGFVSNGPILSLTVVAVQSGGTVWPTVNDLTMGGAVNITAVPEPSGLALGAIAGLAGIGCAWRRRKAGPAA